MTRPGSARILFIPPAIRVEEEHAKERLVLQEQPSSLRKGNEQLIELIPQEVERENNCANGCNRDRPISSSLRAASSRPPPPPRQDGLARGEEDRAERATCKKTATLVR